jgi:hypothetical protein
VDKTARLSDPNAPLAGLRSSQVRRTCPGAAVVIA